jgi:hypothetical protein
MVILKIPSGCKMTKKNGFLLLSLLLAASMLQATAHDECYWDDTENTENTNIFNSKNSDFDDPYVGVKMKPFFDDVKIEKAPSANKRAFFANQIKVALDNVEIIRNSESHKNELSTLLELYQAYEFASDDSAFRMQDYIIYRVEKFNSWKTWHEDASLLNFFLSPIDNNSKLMSLWIEVPQPLEIIDFNNHIIQSLGDAVSPLRLIHR